MAKLITVTLLLDMKAPHTAEDWVNETLREMQRVFTPNSDLIDYCVSYPTDYPGPISGYEEGEMVAYIRSDLAGFEDTVITSLHCFKCGQGMILTSTGISHHIYQDGSIDHDADANHVALDEREFP